MPVLVTTKQTEKDKIELYCSGRKIGWVSGKDERTTLEMAKLVVVWFASTYNHDKHGALMEIK